MTRSLQAVGATSVEDWDNALAASTDIRHALAKARGPFAVWGEQADGQSFAAVDRFAQHTLCWRVEGGRLRVAERADTLAGPNDELDPQALFDYLFRHAISAPRTIFRDVRRVPAGHLLRMQGGLPQLQPWWTPRFEPCQRSFAEWKSQFRSALLDSVRRHVGRRPVGSFLSGGTDSSTLAGLLQLATGERPRVYAIGFDADGYDEMAYARIAARHFDAELHEHYVSPQDVARGIPLVASGFDQPFGNSSAVPAYICALRAREDGLACLLGGDGGDELFGGNSRYAEGRVFELWSRFPAGLREGVLRPFFMHPGMARVPVLRRAAGYIRRAETPMPRRLEAYNLIGRIGYGRILDTDFLAAIDLEAPHHEAAAVWAAADASNMLDRQLAYDWRYTLAESDLPKVRGATSLAGLGTGFPFLDESLLDMSLQLPHDHKVRGRQLRWFFKQALADFLPREIIDKPKQGFGLPFGVWMVSNPELRELAIDALRSFGTRGVLQPGFADELVNELLPQHPHYYGTLVWIVAMLEHWLRRHRPNYRFG